MEHLSADQVRQFVERSASPVDLLSIDDHLAVCAVCRDLVATGAGARIDRLRAALEADGRPRQVPVWVWAGGGLALAAALVLAVRLARPAAPPDRAVPPIVASLQDAGGRITIDADGHVQAPDGVPASARDRLRGVLTSGSFGARPDLTAFVGRGGTLLGASAAIDTFGPIAPIGVVTTSDRPVLRWRSEAGASGYRVSVFDDRFALVERSPVTTGTAWTPSTSLLRGGIFVWQVAAIVGSRTVVAPTASDPEARFRVLDDADSQTIQSLRDVQPAPRLIIAAELYRVGALDEAQAEVEELARNNPGAPLPKALLDEIARARQTRQ